MKAIAAMPLPTKMRAAVEQVLSELELATAEAWRLKDENIALRQEIDEVRETVRQMRENKVELRLPQEWRLTNSESGAFKCLLKRGEASKRQICEASSKNIFCVSEDKTADVYIHKVRKKIAKFGIMIETINAYGYRLKDREIWLRKIKAQQ